MSKAAGGRVKALKWRKLHKVPAKHIGHQVIGAGTAIRSLTAAVVMMMAVLSPVNITESYAAPVNENKSLAAIVEVADNVVERDKNTAVKFNRQQRAKQLAKKLRLTATASEGMVIADMKDLEQADSYLQGLEYRVKSEASLTRKVIADAKEKQLSLTKAAAGIGDALRYTLITEPKAYTERVPKVLEQLEAKGYKVVKFRNAWGGKFYQGVNTQMVAPDSNVKIELQFHTPQSFAIKQASHEVYEIRRNPQSTPAEVEQAVEQSIAYNNLVEVPQGAKAISWNVA